MAMIVVQAAAGALEIVVGDNPAQRLEPHAQLVVELPDEVDQLVVRRVPLTAVEADALATS